MQDRPLQPRGPGEPDRSAAGPGRGGGLSVTSAGRSGSPGRGGARIATDRTARTVEVTVYGQECARRPRPGLDDALDHRVPALVVDGRDGAGRRGRPGHRQGAVQAHRLLAVEDLRRGRRSPAPRTRFITSPRSEPSPPRIARTAAKVGSTCCGVSCEFSVVNASSSWASDPPASHAQRVEEGLRGRPGDRPARRGAVRRRRDRSARNLRPRFGDEPTGSVSGMQVNGHAAGSSGCRPPFDTAGYRPRWPSTFRAALPGRPRCSVHRRSSGSWIFVSGPRDDRPFRGATARLRGPVVHGHARAGPRARQALTPTTEQRHARLANRTASAVS